MSEFKNMTALITGAHGFIGKHLTQALSNAGCKVYGVGHGIWPETDAAAWGMSQWVNGDITPTNLRLLQQSASSFDFVFHLAGGSSVGAAVANPREDFFRTVATTVELLDWMRLDAPTAKLVAVSSAAVYGAGHAGHISEQTYLHPYSPYGHHKRLMEELCHSYAASYGIRTVIARLFSVYGGGLMKQLLWDLCTRLSAGADPLTMGGSGEELRDWIDVRDVVRAISLLSMHATCDVPVFNVGTGVPIAVKDAAARLAKQWADASSTPELRFSGQSRPGDPFSLVADTTKLLSLGFETRIHLEQGLADYVDWFRKHGMRVQ